MNWVLPAVAERGRRIEFSFEAMLDFHGPGSPGGVAQAFKVLERGLPLLDPEGPPERRELGIRTAFGGPGARDGFELVTRAVSDDRYLIDPSLSRPELGRARERFVFELGYRDRTVTLVLRDGFVSEEFIALARTEDRTDDEEARLATMKLELAELLMARPATEIYDLAD